MTPHLEQFARQLQSWTQELIDHGRTPFRRVDCFIDIVTEIGILTPPLIFWINRQSMMAGGVILLPEKDLTKELERGRSCAAALGLSHFVTWETEQVRLWAVIDEQICEQQRFPLPGADHPDFFRQLLKEIIEALKIPAVTGALPHDKLSASYFHNLFNTAETLAQPALTEAFRSQRAEEIQRTFIDIDQRAIEANRLLLLQILTALRGHLLPDTLLPEELGTIVTEALNQAPEPIRTHLNHNWEGAPSLLPVETAVCYHHLLLRLQQLRWTSLEERMKQSLSNLMTQWFPDYQPEPETAADIILYPQAPPVGQNLRMLLSDSPLLLACTTLLRELDSLPQPTSCYGSLMSLDQEKLPVGSLSAQLLNQSPLTRSEKALYNASLRLSWPHRNFKIHTDQARWKWELVHLLGMIPPDQQIQVEVPAALLETASDEPWWSLLSSHCHLCEISRKEDTLLISLLRTTLTDNPTLIRQADGTTYELFLPHEPDQLRQQLKNDLQLTDTSQNPTTNHSRTVKQVSKNLKQEILDQLNAQGIPNFPDQYLYFLEQPDTVSYSMTPPVKVTSRLLGQFDIVDAEGRTIQGFGEELEQALLICAHSGKRTVDLPKDRAQLEQLLNLYRRDLDSLHQQLSDLSYRQIKKPRAARNLIRSVWKKLTLPAPEWFKN
ncbi:MAG: hypothetical protein R6V33_11050 [Pelovirga sp.]